MSFILSNMEEMEQFNEALRKLRDKVDESVRIARQAEDALHKVATHSHIRSTMTLLREDFALRRLLGLQ